MRNIVLIIIPVILAGCGRPIYVEDSAGHKYFAFNQNDDSAVIKDVYSNRLPVDGQIQNVGTSENGAFMAIASNKNGSDIITCINSRTFEKIASWQFIPAGIRPEDLVSVQQINLAPNDDCTMIAVFYALSGSEQGYMVELRSAGTGQPAASIKMPSQSESLYALSLSFSPDSNLVAVYVSYPEADTTRTSLYVYDVGSRNLVKQAGPMPFPESLGKSRFVWDNFKPVLATQPAALKWLNAGNIYSISLPDGTEIKLD
jgi:hypothetical protein